MQADAHTRRKDDGFADAALARLPDALSFRIARLAAINERSGSHYFRTEQGVSLSEWRVLGLVADGNPATTASLRDTLVMDRGQLSRVVKALIARKLLRSQPNPKDKRQTQLHLTPDGRALFDKCIAFTEGRNRVMASALTPEERHEFSRLLDLMIDHNAALFMQRNPSDD